MAAYDLEEQEQIAEFKAWWKQYGSLLTFVVMAAAVVVLAWRGWNGYQRARAGYERRIGSSRFYLDRTA